MGGGVYVFLSNEVHFNYETNVIDSVFWNNSASWEGGAIKYNLYPPVISNCSFESNSALYGNNIASYPVKMVLDKTEIDQLVSGIKYDG